MLSVSIVDHACYEVLTITQHIPSGYNVKAVITPTAPHQAVA